jgi:hypothetical protein
MPHGQRHKSRGQHEAQGEGGESIEAKSHH